MCKNMLDRTTIIIIKIQHVIENTFHENIYIRLKTNISMHVFFYLKYKNYL